MPTDVELAWAAGFFDGEGTVTIWERRKAGSRKRRPNGRSYIYGRPNFGIRLQVAQIVREPLDKLVAILGGSVRLHRQSLSSVTLANPLLDRLIWQWSIEGSLTGKKGPRTTLMRLLPHLTVKSAPSRLALDFMNEPWTVAERRKIIERLHDLNHVRDTTAREPIVDKEAMRADGFTLPLL